MHVPPRTNSVTNTFMTIEETDNNLTVDVNTDVTHDAAAAAAADDDDDMMMVQQKVS